MQNVTQEIEATQRVVSDLEKQLAAAKQYLEALKTVARLGPMITVSERVLPLVASSNGVSEAKRPFGEMSEIWLRVLTEMAKEPNRKFRHSEILEIARNVGFSGTDHSCRDRVRAYVVKENLSGKAEAGFGITQKGLALVFGNKEGPTHVSTASSMVS